MHVMKVAELGGAQTPELPHDTSATGAQASPFWDHEIGGRTGTSGEAEHAAAEGCD